MVLEKEIIFQEYQMEYSHQNKSEIIYENSHEGSIIYYNGSEFIFAGPLPIGHGDYSFRVNSSELFNREIFSQVEYDRGNRIKIVISKESLEELKRATNPI